MCIIQLVLDLIACSVIHCLHVYLARGRRRRRAGCNLRHCLASVKDVNITSLYLRHKCPINYEI